MQGEDLNHCATAPPRRVQDLFLLDSQIYRGGEETEKKIFHPMIHSPSTAVAGGEPIQSQEPGVSSGSSTQVYGPKALVCPWLLSQATSKELDEK